VVWWTLSGVNSAIAGRGIEPVYVLKVEHSAPWEKEVLWQHWTVLSDSSSMAVLSWVSLLLAKTLCHSHLLDTTTGSLSRPLLTLTCLLCTVKLPSDPVWKEIKWQDTVLFKDANQTVHIQVGLSFSPWPRKISVWCFLPSESSKFFFQVLSSEVGRSFPNPTLFLSQNVTSLKFLCTVVVGSLFPLCLIGYFFPSCSSFSLLATFIHKSEAVWWTQPCCNLLG
jgi:hypothetical protein